LQQNFFLTSRSCDLELEVEEDETDAFLVLVGAMMGMMFNALFLSGGWRSAHGGGEVSGRNPKRGVRGDVGSFGLYQCLAADPPDHSLT
jgi:hypothetical protein